MGLGWSMWLKLLSLSRYLSKLLYWSSYSCSPCWFLQIEGKVANMSLSWHASFLYIRMFSSARMCHPICWSGKAVSHLICLRRTRPTLRNIRDRVGSVIGHWDRQHWTCQLSVQLKMHWSSQAHYEYTKCKKETWTVNCKHHYSFPP